MRALMLTSAQAYYQWKKGKVKLNHNSTLASLNICKFLSTLMIRNTSCVIDGSYIPVSPRSCGLDSIPADSD